MLGLSERDRADLRTGAMRAKGQQWAGLIFWGAVLPRIIAVAAAVAAIIAAVWGLLKVWDRWGYAILLGAGPLGFVAIMFGVMFVAWVVRPRRRTHYRRGRR